MNTLLEVARRAGVSTATVARVIKAKGYVSEGARRRVESAIRATGYRPNAIARGLRQRRSSTIGHIVTAITANPFFANVAHWAEEEALQHGYKTFLFNHNGSPDRERLGVEQFIERRVDAVLFTNAAAAENVRLLRSAQIPAIQLERVCAVRLPSIRVDNRVGALQAMRHLIALGHRRIAFVGGDPDLVPVRQHRFISVEQERYQAFEIGLKEAGLTPRPGYIKFGPYYHVEDGGSGIEGYRHMQTLLKLRERPTAIFATCDILAAGVLRAVYEAGLRVPEDFSVVGFDDTLALNLTPPLTTVAQPMEELGRVGFRFALSMIEGNRPELIAPLPSRLIVRASTGPPSMR